MDTLGVKGYSMNKTKAPRPVQPLCETCQHPASFHSGKVGERCKALGCHCSAFIIAKASLAVTFVPPKTL